MKASPPLCALVGEKSASAPAFFPDLVVFHVEVDRGLVYLIGYETIESFASLTTHRACWFPKTPAQIKRIKRQVREAHGRDWKNLTAISQKRRQ